MALGIALGVLITGWGLACVFDVRGWRSRRVRMAANAGRGRGYAERPVATRVAVGLAITAIGLVVALAATL